MSLKGHLDLADIRAVHLLVVRIDGNIDFRTCEIVARVRVLHLVCIALAHMLRAVVRRRDGIARDLDDDGRALDGHRVGNRRGDKVLLRDVIAARIKYRVTGVREVARVFANNRAVRRHMVLDGQDMAWLQPRHGVSVGFNRGRFTSHARDVVAELLRTVEVIRDAVHHDHDVSLARVGHAHGDRRARLDRARRVRRQGGDILIVRMFLDRVTRTGRKSRKRHATAVRECERKHLSIRSNVCAGRRRIVVLVNHRLAKRDGERELVARIAVHDRLRHRHRTRLARVRENRRVERHVGVNSRRAGLHLRGNGVATLTDILDTVALVRIVMRIVANPRQSEQISG